MFASNIATPVNSDPAAGLVKTYFYGLANQAMPYARRTRLLRALQTCEQACSPEQSSLRLPFSFKRREAVLGGRTGLWFACSPPSNAAILKSIKSDKPGALTLRNDLEAAAKVYWLNYDGECPLSPPASLRMRQAVRRALNPPSKCQDHVAWSMVLYDLSIGALTQLLGQVVTALILVPVCAVGDPEFFAALPPGGYFTVDTFEVHSGSSSYLSNVIMLPKA